MSVHYRAAHSPPGPECEKRTSARYNTYAAYVLQGRSRRNARRVAIVSLRDLLDDENNAAGSPSPRLDVSRFSREKKKIEKKKKGKEKSGFEHCVRIPPLISRRDKTCVRVSINVRVSQTETGSSAIESIRNHGKDIFNRAITLPRKMRLIASLQVMYRVCRLVRETKPTLVNFSFERKRTLSLFG